MNYESYIKTDKNGVLHIYNKGHFNQYFLDNPSKDFIMKIEMINSDKSNRLFAYYHAEVIPKLIQGFRNLGVNHNKMTMMEEIKNYSPVMWESNLIDGKVEHQTRSFDELNFFERKRHIDECIIFAAEHIETIIDEPK